MWLLTPVFSLSLVPYILFSIFHYLTYLQNTLLPKVLTQTKDASGKIEENKIIGMIGRFNAKYNERCMFWVASTELLIEIILILRAIAFYRRSWIMFALFSLFIKIRYELSKYTKTAFAKWRVRMDGIISHPSVPPKIKEIYNLIKTKLIHLSGIPLTSARAATTEASKNQ